MLALLLLLTALLLFLAWRLTAGRRPATPPARPRYLAPDDDPDFLRELNRRTQRDDEQT